jgi:MFS family permease
VHDARLIYTAGFLRSATVSFVGVTLAIHLANLGFSVASIGLLIGIGLAGSSVATVVVSLRGDSWGRRRVLLALTMLTAVGYLALAAFTQAAVLLPLAFLGMVNGMGRDRGAASALEQAILPATVPDERRTWALAWYNMVLDGGHALGALAAATPTLLTRTTAVSPDLAHRITFAICAGSILLCIAPYLALTPGIEVSSRSSLAPAPVYAGSKRVIAYDVLLYRAFRHVSPPEEKAAT